MRRCLCNDHTQTEPGTVRCGIAHDVEIERIERALLSSLVYVSDVLSESGVIDVRPAQPYAVFGDASRIAMTEPVLTGAPALTALTAGDFCEFGRIVHAALLKRARIDAEDEHNKQLAARGAL